MNLKLSGLQTNELPREKLIKYGVSNLTEVELLAILLRTGTKERNVLELSREILEVFDINFVSRRTFQELLKFKGVNSAKACTILATFELARRLSVKKKKKVQINSSKDVFDFVNFEFSNLGFEKVLVAFVDSKNFVIKTEVLFEGSVSYSVIDARVVLKKALVYDASGFFLVHNHPSGDSTPSSEDIEITNKIKELSNSLEIRFLDHIIIGDEYYSLFDNERM